MSSSSEVAIRAVGPGTRKHQVNKLLPLSWLCPHLWETILIGDWCGRAQSTVAGTTHRQMGLGCVGESMTWAPGQARMQHPSMIFYLHSCLSSYLAHPWSQAATWMWKLKQTLPHQVDFTPCFITTTKQSRMVSVMNEPSSMVPLQLTHSAS